MDSPGVRRGDGPCSCLCEILEPEERHIHRLLFLGRNACFAQKNRRRTFDHDTPHERPGVRDSGVGLLEQFEFSGGQGDGGRDAALGGVILVGSLVRLHGEVSWSYTPGRDEDRIIPRGDGQEKHGMFKMVDASPTYPGQ